MSVIHANILIINHDRVVSKINCIKIVRVCLGIGLREAKDFVEEAMQSYTSIKFICTPHQFGLLIAHFHNIEVNLGVTISFDRIEDEAIIKNNFT